MNPKAAFLALAALLTIFPLETQSQIVPWRGIKNNIFPPHEEGPWSLPSSDIGPLWVCGFGLDFSPPIPQFQAATNSIPNSDPNLITSLWSAPPIHNPTIIENRAILRRISCDHFDHLPNPKIVLNGKKRSARIGEKLGSNDRLKTLADVRIDLFLGDNGPVLVVKENSDLEISRLDLDNAGLEKIIDTRLHLRAGRILGNVKKLAPKSTYLVRTQNNLIRIRGTEYQIDADGTCAIVSGTAEVITPTHIHTVHAGEKYSP